VRAIIPSTLPAQLSHRQVQAQSIYKGEGARQRSWDDRDREHGVSTLRKQVGSMLKANMSLYPIRSCGWY
jgi:hypothetical protein